MNEDNQISVFGYHEGAKVLQVDFKPSAAKGDANFVPSDANGAARNGAMLWAASWRPDAKGDLAKHQDRAASPPPKGVKRVKGLPAENSAPAAGGGAYRPKGGGGFSGIAAMMRGELPTPDAVTAPAPGAVGYSIPPPQLTWQEQAEEQKKWDKEKKALQKKQKEAENQAVEDKLNARANVGKAIEDKAKLLKSLKEQLAHFDKLKDKEWDELTEEDEAELEGEIDVRAQIAELEKGGSK